MKGMSEGTKFTLMVLAGASFIAGLIAFFLVSVLYGAAGSSSFWLFAAALPLAGITISMGIFLKMKRKSAKSGLPLEDEMSQRIKERSGYIAYIFTAWAMLILMFFLSASEELGFLQEGEVPARYIIYFTFLALFSSYFAAWAVLGRKGLKKG